MKCAKPYSACFTQLMPSDDLQVLYADESMLVFDKPAGLLSVPGRGEDKQDCLSARAQRQFSDARVVHRLDMATSGLMVMARGAAAQRHLNVAFASRDIAKRYVAVVHGHLPAPAERWGVIDLPIIVDWPNRPRRVIDPISGKPSLTRWRVLTQAPAGLALTSPVTRIELEPVTGRSHQLRVHLLAMGHAIAGDQLYGSPEVQAMASRLLLHACSLELQHPRTGQTLRFGSPAPF
jgi:tRNA pseudouridine32 synthase/23S rRNA pseudouridine746 synthase